MGVVAEVIGPDRFRTLPCPTYPDIRLSVLPRRKLAKMMTEFRPDALHIATEGPLGIAARKLARSRKAGSLRQHFIRAFPNIWRARTRVPTCADLCLAAAVSQCRPWADGGDGKPEPGTGRTRIPAFARVVARGGSGGIFKPAPGEGVGGFAAAGVSVCRPRWRWRKNIGAFLSAGSARIESGGRRRAANGDAEGQIFPERAFRRRASTARRSRAPMPAAT